MAIEPENAVSLSGLTGQEAKEFHAVFVASFTGFTLLALFVHILTYIWRPWPYPSNDQMSSLNEAATTISQLASPFIG